MFPKSTLGKLRLPLLRGLYELKCTFRSALTQRAKFSVLKRVVLLKESLDFVQNTYVEFLQLFDIAVQLGMSSYCNQSIISDPMTIFFSLLRFDCTCCTSADHAAHWYRVVEQIPGTKPKS